MADPAQLEGLIGELRQSTSRLEQLKILTRAWRVLKDLSARQRLDLALHLGIEEGAPLLESLGAAGGLSPATLARAVAKAERAQPDDLDAILRGLRTPGERLAAIRHGVDLVEDTLRGEDEGAALPASPEKKEKALPAKSRPRRPRPPIPLKEGSPAPSPEPAVLAPRPPSLPAPPKIKEPAEAAKAGVLEQPDESLPVEAPTPAIAESKAQPREAPVEPASAPSSKPAPAPSPLETRWAAVSQPAAPKLPPVSVQASLAKKSLLAQFRDWRRILDGDGLTAERLSERLAEFPSGWPRRRALMAAIRSKAFGDTDALLSEIARLESPSDEAWCLSALAHSRRLTAAQLENALSRARTASSRRLLIRLLREAKDVVSRVD